MKNPCVDHEVGSNRQGYGVIRHLGKSQLLHRVVYCKANGIPIDSIKGKVVRHSCDNPKCIEPTHLLIGTQADNVRDMLERGRQRFVPFIPKCGPSNPNAKLTLEKANAIRAARLSGMKQKDLAEKFGVSCTLVSYVLGNKIWAGPVAEINAVIAPLSISADGLAELGFKHEPAPGSAKLYRLGDLPATPPKD